VSRLALLAVVALAATGCAATADDMYRAPYPQQGWPQQGWPGAAHPPPATWSPPAAAWGQAPYQWGRASFYTDRLAGRATATGEPYDPGAFTAAHRTLPLGTFVDVARGDGRHVTVRINDRGPYADGRIIDLSRRAATEIGMLREGVVEVALRVLWVPPPKARRM
jgi:rare lipoprotein A